MFQFKVVRINGELRTCEDWKVNFGKFVCNFNVSKETYEKYLKTNRLPAIPEYIYKMYSARRT